MFIPALFFLFHTDLQLTSEIEKSSLSNQSYPALFYVIFGFSNGPMVLGKSKKKKKQVWLMSKEKIVHGVSTINPFGVFLLIITPP